jgi:translation initiation factor 1A
MARNSTGGKQAKKRKNGVVKPGKRIIELAEDGQTYGKINKMLGDMRCEVLCEDGITRICKIRGKMKRRVWITCGDIVLVCMREYQDEKGDIIHKYLSDEVNFLRERGEITMDEQRNTISADTTIEGLMADAPSQLPTDGDIGIEIDFSNI